MSSLSPEEGPPRKLSAEELRQKRLQALDPSAATAVENKTKRSRPAAADMKPAVAVASRASAAVEEVVDLCSDDDEDEEDVKAAYDKSPPTKKKRASKAPLRQDNATFKTSFSSKKQQEPGFAKRDKQESRHSLSRFQVASYNLWFGPQGDGEPHAEDRMLAVAQILLDRHDPENNPLLFIAFQEVVEELAALLFPRLERAGYRILRQPHQPAYGCAMAVYVGRKTVGGGGSTGLSIIEEGWQAFDRTRMARGLLYVRARWPSSKMQDDMVCTCTHLESFVDKNHNGSEYRQIQLQEMAEFGQQELRKKPTSHCRGVQTVIHMGDMNWDDTSKSRVREPEMFSLISADYQDAWLATHGKGGSAATKNDPGYTYDGKLNPMLSNSLRRRFDRCLIRNRAKLTQARVRPTDATLLGTEALPGLTWGKFNPWNQSTKTMPTAPSDHFGLLAQLEL